LSRFESADDGFVDHGERGNINRSMRLADQGGVDGVESFVWRGAEFGSEHGIMSARQISTAR
jgi:hypothetical protein